LRARIVLACAQGGSNLAVAARLGVNRSTVSTWRASCWVIVLAGPDAG
jgi:transposase-like protein